MSLDTTKIKQVPLKETQYFKEEIKNNWDTDDRGRIATCVTISGKGLSKDTYDGEICQAFSSKYWAYHLGVKGDVFRANGVPAISLDKLSIGIEICSWGPLEKRGAKFYNYVDREVPADQVTELATPYKGYKFYHRYTDAQIESTKNLLMYWRDAYGIDLTYNDDIWSVSKRALRGESGVFTHNSYRKDKTDIHPCPRMIAMLKTL